ncbi:MAG: PEP-CTERM sorting domain-containing protein [Rhodocyclaceae bacterium]|nr:PEP-CTERM sorting domain-containing protein [Rhodocyclaceae bacterium]
MRFRRTLLLGLAATLPAAAVHAAPIELITNGGFETGTAAGWTLTDAGSGGTEVTSANAPSNGTFTTPGASSGTFYAVTSQGGPGTHALSQVFSVGAGAQSVVLSFDMFVQTQQLVNVNSAGLDHTATPNQHARVDILTSTAGAFETGPGVLANFYLGIDGLPTQPYTSYQFDVTSLLSAGGTFALRFAQVDNLGNFNMGVDNVSLLLTTADVPEPSSLALFGIALAGLGYRRRKA